MKEMRAFKEERMDQNIIGQSSCSVFDVDGGVNMLYCNVLHHKLGNK